MKNLKTIEPDEYIKSRYLGKNTKGDPTLQLSNIETMMLVGFNKCCQMTASNSKFLKEFPQTDKGLFKLRSTALKIFVKEYSSKEFHMNLLSGLLKTKPHWNFIFLNGKSKFSTIDKITVFLSKCSRDSEGMESRHPIFEDYIAPFARYVGESKSHENWCMVHPERKSNKRGLCTSCEAKLIRLNLENYPLSLDLVYVLKVRQTKSGIVGKKFCPNHPRKLVMENGLCIVCNNRIGNLEKIFLEAGLLDYKGIGRKLIQGG